MALVTGGTPKTVGAFYDVAYDRVLAPPMTTTGNGLAGGGSALPDVNNGTQTEYEEGVEIDQTKVNGGGPYSTLDGGVLSIDPNKLLRDPFNGCNPVYPWNFIRTNTIYGVIHGRAATPPGPTSTPSTPPFPDRPEHPTPATWTITTRRKSTPIRFRLPGVHTAGTKFDCSEIRRQQAMTGRPISNPSSATTS